MVHSLEVEVEVHLVGMVHPLVEEEVHSLVEEEVHSLVEVVHSLVEVVL
jgi:hypothetical protein